ncbi:MAG: anaerobic sulfatase maturase [Thermodesulfobacteriota bacterium]
MAKPAGPTCNLACETCFYLEKKTFFPGEKAFRMTEEVLDAYTRKYISAFPGPGVVFAWQGGEPALRGIEFFKRAVALQKKYGSDRHIENTFQTNGTLLTEDWCGFLAVNNFLVGLSLDGPPEIHDVLRRDRAGKPSAERVLSALALLRRHGAEVNVLCCVHRENARRPLDVYRFFRDRGIRFIQFIPVVEREPDPQAKIQGLALAAPSSPGRPEASGSPTPWSVRPEEYGAFLNAVFDEWVRNDVGRVFVMNFEWALGAWAGAAPGVCYLSSRCGSSLILEHNGDVYSCDHYMYPGFRLGNILTDDLAALVRSERQLAFGAAKETSLPGYCLSCRWLFACRGGCPKQRFAASPDGEPGMNLLCAGLQSFYGHIEPHMSRILALLRSGTPAAKIMAEAAEREVG